MKQLSNILLTLLLTFTGLSAQITYEDFEGGTADLGWIGLNGTYNGAVENPDKSGANTSGHVGSYSNVPTFDFCFALYTFPAPLDLSEYNQFKMKIWSPTAPAKALLKLEGPGGPPIEQFVDITEANKWVEYTFDFSKAAAQGNLKTILVSFNSFVLGDSKTYYFDDITASKPGTCFADFEGPGLNFLGLDGTLTSPVDNPGANKINSSAKCAQYVKSNKHAYSLILADNGTPFDLSVNNQFKMDIYATAPTQVLMKLEGSGGNIEKIKNIAVTGAWQTYTFDFSAQAANTGLSKVVLFFDPGVETSSDTYYFDNVCAAPAPCPGVTPNPDILDDFECNRNATYALGWDSIAVVKNPNVSADNSSPKVGQWHDPAGPGTEWAALVIDNETPFDLSTKNEFSVQVWAPKKGKLLIKLEGGPNPAKEIFVDMVETGKWVTYKGDFSDQAGKGHRKWVLFFNAGVNGEAGDTYYFDNIKVTTPAALPPLEDFQTGLHLGWQPLDQNEPIHGIFQGPVNNPSPISNVNPSTKVGCYTKGSGAFSTLQAFSLTPFDLSKYAQLNLDVLSPAGASGKVRIQLSSPTQGNKEVDATLQTPGQWETMSFDFSAFNAIKDFGEIRILFVPGTAASGQKWYFDNLRQTEVTIDPCAGTIPVGNIMDDFECQRNNAYGAGKDQIKAVNNPHLTPQNGSLKVGEYRDPANDPWTALCLEFPDGIDLSLYNQLSLQVWGPASVPMLFKLEGGSSPAKEIWDTLRTANAWYRFNVDFSSEIGKNHKRVCIFFNAGQNNPETVYFLDNIRWARAGYNGCVSDHEKAASSIETYKYFANGHLEAEGLTFSIVDNPQKGGINTSDKVGKFVKASDGAPFAGMYADLEAPIDWKGVKTAKAKVLMDHIGNFAIKVEGSQTGASALELPVANTKINQWEELSYNFAVVPDNAEYKRLTLFFDLTIDATGQDVTSYFDDIVFGAGACGSVGIFNPLPLEAIQIAPNPTSDLLRVENFYGVDRLEVFNALGQRVASISASGETRTEISVSNFPNGVYALMAFNAKGMPIGKAKFVKGE